MHQIFAQIDADLVHAVVVRARTVGVVAVAPQCQLTSCRARGEVVFDEAAFVNVVRDHSEVVLIVGIGPVVGVEDVTVRAAVKKLALVQFGAAHAPVSICYSVGRFVVHDENGADLIALRSSVQHNLSRSVRVQIPSEADRRLVAPPGDLVCITVSCSRYFLVFIVLDEVFPTAIFPDRLFLGQRELLAHQQGEESQLVGKAMLCFLGEHIVSFETFQIIISSQRPANSIVYRLKPSRMFFAS